MSLSILAKMAWLLPVKETIFKSKTVRLSIAVITAYTFLIIRIYYFEGILFVIRVHYPAGVLMGNLPYSNIVSNGIGTTGGLADNVLSGAHGIFSENCVEEADLMDITISNCHGLGIYMHAINHVNLLGNTCFNNDICQLILYDHGGPCNREAIR